VELAVYNVLGRKVATLVDEYQGAGPHTVTWDGTDAQGNGVAGGIYFYRISTAEFKETRKMLYLK
jgi:flagellar hook assembly protein FlgD